mmetsp:Transcript_27375/g.78662  ORF Transcript_27375/g.78662 Transcript_27375/m.78662 type:complete len:236 (-) Transcript_27375:642-1349(-)
MNRTPRRRRTRKTHRRNYPLRTRPPPARPRPPRGSRRRRRRGAAWARRPGHPTARRRPRRSPPQTRHPTSRPPRRTLQWPIWAAPLPLPQRPLPAQRNPPPLLRLRCRRWPGTPRGYRRRPPAPKAVLRLPRPLPPACLRWQADCLGLQPQPLPLQQLEPWHLPRSSSGPQVRWLAARASCTPLGPGTAPWRRSPSCPSRPRRPSAAGRRALPGPCCLHNMLSVPQLRWLAARGC